MAAASGRVAHVLLKMGTVVDLGMSRKASSGPPEAQAYAAQQIESLRPDLVITEKVLSRSKKGPKTREIIAAITSVANVADVMNVEIVRLHSYSNRFEEARDLARRYPAMRPYLPKVRKPWEAEPKVLIYFEALSLTESVFGTAPADDSVVE
ncbi:hypothetical protein C6W92_06610 [Roseovarius sp. A46]|uniref:hypothetical protein n=1 Tax=Roseovarius sp. A46 TaxID=2109331 RepID=UPI001013220A|nr:hypothetical protein [Roseovarius sp. A46]RXV64722.1 hypothetical protein C6W92_06610 [Roseovarius sp. A46]